MSGAPGIRAAVLPPVPALLPEHAGLVDPVPGLRAGCRAALADLLAGARTVVVLHDPLSPTDAARGACAPMGVRVPRALLAEAGWAGDTAWRTPDADLDADLEPGAGAVLLVMANGSARRGEKAPGHLDERCFAFDDALERALVSADPGRLRSLDADLGDDLMAAGTRCLHRLGEALEGRSPGADRPPEVTVHWAGDPYGVQYWVAVLGVRPPSR